MRQHFGLLLTASIIFLSQGVQGSNINHDDDGDAPVSASAPAAPINHDDDGDVAPDGVVTSISTHSGLTLCTPQGLVSMNERFFNLNTLASVRGLPFFNPLQVRYMFVMGQLASQMGNSTLFMQDHFADLSHFTLPQLEELVPEDPIKGPLEEPLKGALNPETPEGQAYFKLKAILEDTSQVEVFYGNKGLRLCPPLRDATHLTKLSLSYNQLTIVPRLNDLANLGYLDLSDNQLKVAPVLAGLPNLQVLLLDKNQITEPPVVSGLTNLIYLDLSHNQLREAPDVTGLTNLVELYLNNNQLREAPDVTGLTNLVKLCLYKNKITAAPDVTRLTNLQRLDLSNNQLTEPPVLTGLLNLEWLDLSYNQLRAAPDVSGLTNLVWLFLDSNLCEDSALLKTLRDIIKARHNSKLIMYCAFSKDDAGKEVITKVSLD